MRVGFAAEDNLRLRLVRAGGEKTDNGQGGRVFGAPLATDIAIPWASAEPVAAVEGPVGGGCSALTGKASALGAEMGHSSCSEAAGGKSSSSFADIPAHSFGPNGRASGAWPTLTIFGLSRSGSSSSGSGAVCSTRHSFTAGSTVVAVLLTVGLAVRACSSSCW